MNIEEIKTNMSRIRESNKLWDKLSYSDGANYLTRYALAIQLQYDLKDSDHALVRFLMENETLCRKNASYQGIGDSLILISYLLAKFKYPSDVFLFEKAKYANFDTYCGYPNEFIFSAGVKATCDYIASVEITEENHFLFEHRDRLRTIYNEDQISTFIEKMNTKYPSNYLDESTKSLLNRAILFNDYSECNRLFTMLEKENPSDYKSLYYYAKRIMNYDRAIYYGFKIFDVVITPQDKVSSLHNISDMCCLNNDYDNAYIIAFKIMKYLKKFDDWKHIGLGRMITETWFNICLGYIKKKDRNGATKSFKHADIMLRTINSHSLNLLRKSYECSLKLEKTKKIKQYKLLLDKELDRVDSMMSKVRRKE